MKTEVWEQQDGRDSIWSRGWPAYPGEGRYGGLHRSGGKACCFCVLCVSVIHLFSAALGFFLAAASGGSSLVAGTGVSPRWPLSLQSLGSRACVLWCLWLLPGVWNVPEPGLEPVSPALTGGFFSTGPPGKSRCTV